MLHCGIWIVWFQSTLLLCYRATAKRLSQKYPDCRFLPFFLLWNLFGQPRPNKKSTLGIAATGENIYSLTPHKFPASTIGLLGCEPAISLVQIRASPCQASKLGKSIEYGSSHCRHYTVPPGPDLLPPCSPLTPPLALFCSLPIPQQRAFWWEQASDRRRASANASVPTGGTILCTPQHALKHVCNNAHAHAPGRIGP